MLDYIKSVKAILFDRLSSPFTGSFLVAWLVINWKIPVIMLTGSMTGPEKIAYIEGHYLNYWHNLSEPVLAALVLTVIYPYAEFVLFIAWSQAKMLRIQRADRLEKTKLMTFEEGIALRLQMERKDKELAESITAKEKREQELNDMLHLELKRSQNRESEDSKKLRELEEQIKGVRTEHAAIEQAKKDVDEKVAHLEREHQKVLANLDGDSPYDGSNLPRIGNTLREMQAKIPVGKSIRDMQSEFSSVYVEKDDENVKKILSLGFTITDVFRSLNSISRINALRLAKIGDRDRHGEQAMETMLIAFNYAIDVNGKGRLELTEGGRNLEKLLLASNVGNPMSESDREKA